MTIIEHAICRVCLTMFILVTQVLIPDSVFADQESSVGDKKRDKPWFDILPGEPAENRLYVGMWSQHVLSSNDDYRTNNNLLGSTYKGYYLGTFINSHNDRSWSVGWQRDFYKNHIRKVKLHSGYRFGLLYGYESYEIGDTRLFPLIQMYTDLSYEKLGVQFSWAAEVITGGLFYRF